MIYSTLNHQKLPFSDPTHPPLWWRNTWMLPNADFPLYVIVKKVFHKCQHGLGRWSKKSKNLLTQLKNVPLELSPLLITSLLTRKSTKNWPKKCLGYCNKQQARAISHKVVDIILLYSTPTSMSISNCRVSTYLLLSIYNFVLHYN